MQLKKFEQRINDLLDQRIPLDSDPTLRDCAEENRQCKQLLARYEELQEGVQLLDRPTPRAGFEDRVLGQLPGTRRRRAVHRRYVLVALTLAGSVLLSITALNSNIWDAGNQQNSLATGHQALDGGVADETMRSDVRPHSPGVPSGGTHADVVGRPSPQVPAENIDEESQPLTPDRVASIDSYLAVLASIENVASGFQLQPDQPPEAEQGTRSEWIDSVTGGFKPLAVSMNGVLRALRDTLPAINEETPDLQPQAAGAGTGGAAVPA